MKSMNRGKLPALLALLLCAALLSGCQLAREDDGKTEQDRLIGAFLTWEYLDLFDNDAFLQDHMQDIARGKTITANGDKYQGKLYATRLENGDYTFGDLAGMNFFIHTWVDENGNCYTGICSDDGISEGDTHIHVKDEGTTYTIQGKVYVAPADYERTLYQNPVYQTADGQVYCMAGTGMMFASAVGEFKTTWEETTSSTDTEGNIVENSLMLEIAVQEKAAPDEVAFLQMDENHQLLSAQLFAPEQVPLEMMLQDECAYLLVESRSSSGTERSLCQPQDESFTVYACRKDLVLTGRSVKLTWPQ